MFPYSFPQFLFCYSTGTVGILPIPYPGAWLPLINGVNRVGLLVFHPTFTGDLPALPEAAIRVLFMETSFLVYKNKQLPGVHKSLAV